MRKFKYLLITVVIASSLLLGACNLPTGGSSEDAAATTIASTSAAVFTHAAETAVVTGVPSATTVPGVTALPTNTLVPTIPPVPATNTPIPCNRGSFVEDVTIPDGKEIAPGAAFTKTWRIKNNGSCTWGANYVVLFDSGDQMGAPATAPIGGSVAPGATIDLSVNLTAPASPGNYQGNFKLRSHDNIVFGINADGQGPFWVKIVVLASTATPALPTLPPPIAMVELPLISASSGMVNSIGTVYNPTNAGDNMNNNGIQAFLTFDMSSLPAGITIDSVSLKIPSYDTLGSPFTNLGCLRMYTDNYGSLDGGDYFAGSPSGAYGRWCNGTQLSAGENLPDLKNYLQSNLGAGTLQFRMQFNEHETNGDGIGDVVRLGSGMNLSVVYH